MMSTMMMKNDWLKKKSKTEHEVLCINSTKDGINSSDSDAKIIVQMTDKCPNRSFKQLKHNQRYGNGSSRSEGASSFFHRERKWVQRLIIIINGHIDTDNDDDQ